MDTDPYEPFVSDYHWMHDEVGLRIGTTTPGVRGALHHLAPRARVLDVACGIGIDLVALARRAMRVCGADASPAMVREARRRIAAAGLSIPVIVSRWDELADHLAPDTYDALLCVGNAIPHARDADEMVSALRAWRPLLDERGIVIIDAADFEVARREIGRPWTEVVPEPRGGVRCTRHLVWLPPTDPDGPYRLEVTLALDDGSTIREHRHHVELFAFTPSDLRERLRCAGYRVIGFDAGEQDRYTVVATPL